MLLCVVYVSEGLRPAVTSLLKTAATSQSSILVHSFEDKTYNRTSYYFLGGSIQESVLSFARTAFQSIDFTQHQGTHPTLGTVDHISFVPLENATMLDATNVAQSFCQSFVESFQVPIYTYGELSPTKLKLKDLRKQLGYFGVSSTQSTSSPPVADFVPSITNTINHGITCVGVVPFVLNFNIRFRSIDPRQKVTQITQHVRSTYVESLTLPHEDGSFESACNLLNWQVEGPEIVLQRAQAKAVELGIEITKSYTTGPSAQDLLAKYRASL